MKVNVWLLVGYSGSGKTTLAESICSKLDMPKLSYRTMLDELAHQSGYVDRGDFFCNKSKDEFKILSDAYIIEKIDSSTKTRNSILVEGLCSLDGYYRMCNDLSDHAIKMIYIDVPETERVQRIEMRDGHVWNRKESTKSSLGLDDLVKLADYILDGSKPSDVVLGNAIDLIVEKKRCLVNESHFD